MFPQFTPRSISARLRLNPEEEEERKRGIADLNKRLQEMGARQPILENGGARPFSPRPELQENEAQSEDDMQPMLRSGSVRAFSHLPERRADHAEDAFADADSHESFAAPEPAGGDDEGAYGSPFPNEISQPAQAMPGIFAEYEQQHSSRGQPSSSRSFSRSAPTLNPDALPATQPLPDSVRQPGMPWDNRPPATSSAPPQPPGSRWLQKLQPPGARGLQAAKGGAQAQQGGMQTFQAAAPAQPKQGGGSNIPPATQAPKQGQSPAPNAAGAGQSAEQTPAPPQQIKVDASNPKFEAAARAALADEAANSPVAAALQKEADRLGIAIIPQKGLNMSETKLVDGKPVIHFNPFRKTDTTMSHEITHAIQTTAYQEFINDAIKHGKKIDQNILDQATKAGQDAVAKIVPVHSTEDTPNDRRENEAMRIANIVNAERTASEMKNLPEEQKNLAEFQRRQAEKEKARGEPEKGRKHPNNNNPIPAGTERGKYDNQYVRDVLGLDEKGQKKPRPPSPVRPLPPP